MARVCFIHGQGYKAFKNKSVGGTQLQLKNISQRLADRDHEIKFITNIEGKEEEIGGVQLIGDMGSAETYFNKILSGARLIKALMSADSDIYFSSNSNMEVGVVGLYCWIFNKKHITRTVHEMQVNKRSVLSRGLKGLINHLGLRQADIVLVQSEDHKERLSNWVNGDITVFRNSFDIKNKEQETGNKILWVGRRVKWKRPELFIELAEEFPSEQFIMISPREGATENFYEKIEKKASSVDNLELIERVPRDKIQDKFDAAKIFVNTSEQEGFPNTFIEAGLGYTPIMSYKVDPDMFIQEHKCGYSSKGNFQDLKQDMDELLENEEKIREMGENCRSYVEKHHDLEKNILFLENLINQLMEK